MWCGVVLLCFVLACQGLAIEHEVRAVALECCKGDCDPTTLQSLGILVSLYIESSSINEEIVKVASKIASGGGCSTGDYNILQNSGNFCTAGGYVSSTYRVWDIRAMTVVEAIQKKGNTVFYYDLTVCETGRYISQCGNDSVLCQTTTNPNPPQTWTVGARNNSGPVRELSDTQLAVTYTGDLCAGQRYRSVTVNFICNATQLNPSMSVNEIGTCTYQATVQLPLFMCEAIPSTCAYGWYRKNNTCVMCPPGFYNDLLNSDKCIPCPTGSGSNAGAKYCVACPNGYQSVNGICKACGPGTYAPYAGTQVCLPCPAGSYTGWVDTAQSCDQCRPGTYSNAGSPVCIVCPEGFWSGENGSTSCTPCPAGFRVNSPTRDSCLKCPAQTYSPQNSTECLPCPSGTTSPAGAFACF